FQNYGVFLFSSTAVITSSGGAVHVIGQGGGLSASGYTNVGVYLQDGGQIAAGSSGTVTVTGMGGLGTGTQHHGVFVRGTNSRISSSGGPVSVIGQGGGSSSSSDNYGVSMFNGGQITAGNGGTVTVQGTGGASGGGINVGVNLDGNNSLITSSGGAVSVTGQGGSGAPGLNYGVYVHNAGQITAGGNGMVTVQGTGGASTGSLNNGVEVRGIGSRITSSGGAVSVTGQGGGSGTSSVNGGINVTYSGEITAGGSGTVTLQGTGGTGTGGSNYGVSVNSNSARVSSAGGSVSVTGIEGSGLYAYGVLVSNTGTITTAANGGNISIFANSMVILSAISTNAAGSVTLAPYTNGISIDLGGNADPIGGPLGLSDAELDRISTGTLIIGNANSGNITVSTAITRPASTNVQLVSGGNVLLSGGGFDTGGGTLLLDPGASPAAIIPTFNGTDAAASALSLAGDLKLVVNGGTAGNGSSGTYTQLNAVGTVDLTGVGLVLSGSYNPAICQTFTLVVNDGTDAIIGTFNGLPEGAVINMAPFTSLNALISYVGGTGNDVVITVSGDINIQGNGTSIVDGDNSPDLLDGTDFGSTPGAPISRTFTIQNTGGAPLSLGAGAITFSGANASLFSVSNVSLPATINSGSSITFDVIYSPSGIGIHAATVNIANNDCDEGAYDFAITAKSCTVPSFTACPGAPVTGNTQTGVCTAVLTYDVSANGAPMPTLAYAFTGATTGSGSGTGSGSTFNGGNTTVTVTATNFCDASTCVFTVTVVDNFPPSIICPANMTLNASTGQCGTIVNYVLPTASDNCSSVSAQLSSGPASGAYFPVGVTNVVWVADDGSNAPAQCNFTVTVVDAQAPTITCPPNQTKAADPGLCTAVITYATPTATDNCTVGDPQRINGLASGSAFPKGPTLVRWKVTDANGLTRTCSFTVTVNDTQAPSITCPSNQTQGTDPGQCTAVVNYTTPTASDNCTGLGYPVNIGGLPSGGIFGKGITIVTWRVTDAVGLTKTCSFKVTITDVQAPVFTSCPANQTVHAVPNACTAVVTYATPTASDNCSAAPAVTRIVGPASGSTFSVGVTQVTWKATDGAGLSSTCAFTVTVDCPGPEPVEEAAETRSPLPQGMGAEAALRLALAPNPASEQVLLTVWGVGAEGGELLVWDGLGRLVWRSALPAGEEQSVLLRVSEAGLSSGVYSVGLRSGDAALTKRLVISR
ncbi:MAG TPA: HYR domain-containing protein, partial [Saprospiraceae bacterium]|nr:HYR domain-containing protein [Saprospiraceae bacterium]